MTNILKICQKFGIPVVVTLNAFITDTQEEYEFIKKHCEDAGCEFALAKVWEKGGEGGLELAEKVIASIENKKLNINQFMKIQIHLKKRLKKLQKKYMVQMVLHMTMQLQKNYSILSRWDLETSLYV